MDQAPLRFGRYRLHPIQGLSDRGREVRVTPRSLAVLTALARQPGRIVTKQELFRTVWADTIVTDAALTSCIRELRRALDDDARNPRYIETVHRRGYRLLVNGVHSGGMRSAESRFEVPPGQADALEQLRAAAARVSDASIEAVVVTGPPGAGKSTLMRHFIDRLSGPDDWLVCHASCSDPADAWRPLYDMLEQLCRGPSGMAVSSQLRREAPAWLAELATGLTPPERHALALMTSGATARWRNRELHRALTTLAASTPLAMYFEDFDRCDTETLAFVASLLRDAGNASILLLATCSNADNGDSGGLPEFAPAVAGRITEIELEPPDQGAPGADWRAWRPRLDRLDGTARHALEGASVAGMRFTAAEVAAAIDLPEEEVRFALQQVEQQSGIVSQRGRQGWPDGTDTSEFTFRNPLDRAAVLERVPSPRRSEMHRKMGRRLLGGWAAHPSQVASRLAWHFEQAGELGEAVEFRYRTGALARRRGSHAVALKNFRRARVLLESLPPSGDRDLQTAKLCTAIGRELTSTRGLDSAEANRLYGQALELSRNLPASADLCSIVWRLWVFHLNRGPLRTSVELAGRLQALGRHFDDPALLLQAYHAGWGTALMLGELPAVLEQTRLGMAVCGSGVNGSLALTTGCTLHDAHLSDHHAGICAGFFAAWAEGLSGHRRIAVRSLDAAISHARDIEHPFSLAIALTMAAGALAACGDVGLTQLRAREARCIARQRGFAAVQAWASIYEGWAGVELGDAVAGIDLLREGLSSAGRFGMTLFRPFHLTLAAAAEMQCGQLENAARNLEEAFAIAEQVGDRLALAEMHRLRGELNRQIAGSERARRQVEQDLDTAMEIARSQGAVLWEKRALASLERYRAGGGAELRVTAGLAGKVHS
jgi:DNA-binding winged helix-turn-helix (wHTH) protein/tetratricopeptide (TPR) repeat protein